MEPDASCFSHSKISVVQARPSGCNLAPRAAGAWTPPLARPRSEPAIDSIEHSERYPIKIQGLKSRPRQARYTPLSWRYAAVQVEADRFAGVGSDRRSAGVPGKAASERYCCAPAVRPMITAAVTVPIERCSSSCGACARIRARAAIPAPCGLHIDWRPRLAGAKLSRTAALDARSSTVLTAAPSSGTSTCGAMSPGKSLVRGRLLVQVRSSREWLYQTRTPSLVPSST